MVYKDNIIYESYKDSSEKSIIDKKSNYAIIEEYRKIVYLPRKEEVCTFVKEIICKEVAFFEIVIKPHSEKTVLAFMNQCKDLSFLC